MSYDIRLRNPQTQEVCKVERFKEGGTYALDGSTEAHLNVTYNYYREFQKTLDAKEGLRGLYGKTAQETTPPLEKAVDQLGTVRDPDYWKATPGNAGYALSILLRWARLHPDGVWEGD